jgi:hypothetical protein
MCTAGGEERFFSALSITLLFSTLHSFAALHADKLHLNLDANEPLLISGTCASDQEPAQTSLKLVKVNNLEYK